MNLSAGGILAAHNRSTPSSAVDGVHLLLSSCNFPSCRPTSFHELRKSPSPGWCNCAFLSFGRFAGHLLAASLLSPTRFGSRGQFSASCRRYPLLTSCGCGNGRRTTEKGSKSPFEHIDLASYSDCFFQRFECWVHPAVDSTISFQQPRFF